MITGLCWRCEMPGHPAAECRPEPAKDPKELAARINRYVARWIAFEITTAQKRAWITDELKRKKEKAK